MHRRLVVALLLASLLVVREGRASSALHAARAVAQATLGEPISIVTIAPAAAAGGPVGWIALGGVAVIGGGYLLYKSQTDNSASAEAEANARMTQGQRDLDQWQAESEARRQGAKSIQEHQEHSRRLEADHREAVADREVAAARRAQQGRRISDALPALNENLAAATRETQRGVDARVREHNDATRAVADRLRDAEASTPNVSDGEGDTPVTSGVGHAGIQPSVFQTHPHDPGYRSLERSDRYIASAFHAVTTAGTTDRAQIADLGIATLALHQADGRYAAGDVASGDGIVGGIQALVDDVLDYARAQDTVSRGSTFLAGVINGASGSILPQHILPSYEATYHAGRLVGAGIGLTADAAAMVTGALGVVGSGGAASMSGGALSLPAIAVATESAALAGSGAIAATAHGITILDALRNMAMEGDPVGAHLPSNDQLLEGANTPDRNGLTKAGRSLQKHGGRPGSAYPPGVGSVAQRNSAGTKIVEDILNDPTATRIWANRRRFGRTLEVRLPSGKGLRFDEHGNFIHFLEPDL
jgi:hypothetical protein